jgi:hypothetical protein
MPADLQGAYQGIVIATQNPVALDEARGLLAAGEAAVATRNYTAAGAAVANLRELGDRLQQQYEIRIVSRPGERSGVWRYPEDNNAAQNFYLIVEAVGPNGDEVVLPIVSEETGRTERVATWGLRVDESTFNRVAADQRDDGIIQGNVAGVKRRGELDPAYNVATTGAAITEW